MCVILKINALFELNSSAIGYIGIPQSLKVQVGRLPELSCKSPNNEHSSLTVRSATSNELRNNDKTRLKQNAAGPVQLRSTLASPAGPLRT